MKEKISKTNESLQFFNARLDEIGMSCTERLKAKARMAQAEAVADAIASGFNLIRRALKSLTARPRRGPTSLAS